MATDEETEALRERIKHLEKRLKQWNGSRSRKSRGQMEKDLRLYVHDIINGSVQDCINQHGNPTLMGAKASLLKRIEGQLCAPHVRRRLIEKILDCEREALEEAEEEAKELFPQGEEG